MNTDLNHWLIKKHYTFNELTLLLVGLDPGDPYELNIRSEVAQRTGGDPEFRRAESALKVYREDFLQDCMERKVDVYFGEERIAHGYSFEYHRLYKALDALPEVGAGGHRFKIRRRLRELYEKQVRFGKEAVLSWAESKGIPFPYGNPENITPKLRKEPTDSPSYNKQTYLSIIGALTIVLAELDQTNQRPLSTKKIVRSDGISAKAVAEIISKRFDGSNLPLKRSNSTISEALRIIEEAEKSYT